MTTMTMAQRATADAPLRVANPASSQVKPTRSGVKKVFAGRLLAVALGAGVLAATQVITAGTAAVATLSADQIGGHTIIEKTVKAAMTPASETLFDGQLFAAVFEQAFPKAAEPESTGSVNEAEADPNEILTFGSRRAPRWLVETIQKASRTTRVDPVYMMTLADVESSLSPVAKAPTSSAAGLFQFIDRTWLEILDAHAAKHGFEAVAKEIKIVNDDPVVPDASQRAWIMGLKRDPYLSALMAGELIRDMQRQLRLVGERELAEAELYLAHFFGAGSAVRFLQALDEQPNAVAARLFPKAARANRGLFSVRYGKRSRNITVAELYERIDEKIVRRMDRFDVVAQPAGRRGTTTIREATAVADED